MGLASDISKLGLKTLAGINGLAAGTLNQDGDDSAISDATITARTKAPGEGNRDRETITMVLPVSGTSRDPRADGLITFDGESVAWRVISADPFAPGGTVIAWRLVIENFVVRDSSI
jgi:hypothetical protein